MAEKQVTDNPFDDSNFVGGGGLWDGKIVTITVAKTLVHWVTKGSGESAVPVLNDNGQPAFKNVLEVRGIADDEDVERYEQYSAGSLIPTEDGLGFVRIDGTPAAFHKGCEMSKFGRLIKAGGFDVGKLWDSEKKRQNVTGLVGSRFLFKGEPTLDKDGKPKINKKGYEMLRFWPVKYEGVVAAGAIVGVSAPNSELTDKAIKAVAEALGELGGKASRSELVRKLATKLSGDADGNKIIALVAKADFHKGRAWTVDGTGYSL